MSWPGLIANIRKATLWDVPPSVRVLISNIAAKGALEVAAIASAIAFGLDR
jgi:hypothetical protein